MQLLLLILSSVFFTFTRAIHVVVPAGSTECFSVDAGNYKHGISLNYEILRGVAEALETQLTDGKEQVIYSHKGGSGRYIGAIGEAGLHTVCFQSVLSSLGDVVIGFSFHADDPTHEVLSNADATKIKQVQELEDLVYELSVSLDTVKDTQAYMKAIKQYHNDVISSTHSRIVWWAWVEALVLFGVSFWQIAFLHRTLEVRRVL